MNKPTYNKALFLSIVAMLFLAFAIKAGAHFGRLVKVHNPEQGKFQVTITPSYYHDSWYREKNDYNKLIREVAGKGTNLNNIQEDMSILIPWKGADAVAEIKIEVTENIPGKRGYYTNIKSTSYLRDRENKIIFNSYKYGYQNILDSNGWLANEWIQNSNPEPNQPVEKKRIVCTQCNNRKCQAFEVQADSDVNVSLTVNSDGGLSAAFQKVPVADETSDNNHCQYESRDAFINN